MPHRSLQKAIETIQAGNLQEGARLLRVVLQDNDLAPHLQVAGWMWMAETSPNQKFKIDCYNQALAADPNNQDVQQRLNTLLSAQLPPTTDTGGFTPVPPQPPTGGTQPLPPQQPGVSGSQPMQPFPQQPGVSGSQPMQPIQPSAEGIYTLQGIHRTVGIHGGPNGSGTGIFVSTDGLIATTRYVVGGAEELSIEITQGPQMPVRVARSYPEYDLALLHANIRLTGLLPFTNSPTVPENMPITAVAHNGQAQKGERRATEHRHPTHWFPTTLSQRMDAGGNPIFDMHNYLVGILTRTASRSSGLMYGLHIMMIHQAVQQYIQEMQADANRVYCPCCGYVSRARNVGAFYCEICGGILPFAQEVQRFPQPQTEAFYSENAHTPCTNCNSRVGYSDGRCLRCGDENNQTSRR